MMSDDGVSADFLGEAVMWGVSISFSHSLFYSYPCFAAIHLIFTDLFDFMWFRWRINQWRELKTFARNPLMNHLVVFWVEVLPGM